MEPFLDPATQKVSIAFAAPVIGDTARATGLVVYALPVEEVATAMQSTYGSRAALAFDVTWTATERLVSSSETTNAGAPVSGADLQSPPEDAVAGLDGVRRFYSAVPARGTGFTVIAGVSESATLADARAQLWEQVGLTVLALAVMLVLGLFVNRRIGGPVRRLTHAVDRAGQAVRPEPVISEGPREVRQLVESFNGLLAARSSIEDQLRRRAMFDELTGLPNRVVALDRVEHALEQTRRDNDLVAALSIDIDRFSLVNESLGRDVGDRMLIQVAHRIASAIRPGDTLARFYGDEFVVLCEGIASREDAGAVAGRISEALSTPVHEGEREVTISVSTGVAL
ncbi:MAG: diguanylate cyclase, partial [Actinomycetota bacterium]